MHNKNEHQARKRFGQNFLVDGNIIDQILRSIAPKKTDNLVEIGPGQGAITAPLLEYCPSLNVIEIDHDLVPLLKQKFAGYLELTIHQADALKFDFAQLANQESPMRVIGNLPYNISTPLIFHLLSYRNLITDMHFMLQKEVVERMASGPNQKEYGRLSIMCQYHCMVEPLFPVGPNCFNPAPKVDSAIVRLTPHKTLPHPAKDVKIFDQVVRAAFQQRRKTLRNSLKTFVKGTTILEDLSIDGALRPENLSLENYVSISNVLFDQK